MGIHTSEGYLGYDAETNIEFYITEKPEFFTRNSEFPHGRIKKEDIEGKTKYMDLKTGRHISEKKLVEIVLSDFRNFE